MLPTLLNLAYGGNGANKLDAILLLGYVRHEDAQKYLISLLKAKRSDIRAQAIMALSVLDPLEAHDGIIAIAVDDDSIVLAALAYTLGKYADKGDFELLKCLLNNKNGIVVSNAIIALGNLKDERAKAELILLLKEGWPAAASSLGNYLERDVTELLLSAMLHPMTINEKLNKYGRYMQQLIAGEIYSGEVKLTDMRHYSMCALSIHTGTTAVDGLLAMLECGSLEDRAQVVDLLGKMGDLRAVPALITALERFPDNYP